MYWRKKYSVFEVTRKFYEVAEEDPRDGEGYKMAEKT
jgi:hypothetical protein